MMRVAVLAAALALGGCSNLQTSSNKFVIEKRWTRSTLEGEYLAGRRLHRFQPIVTEKLIIAANSIDGIVAYDRSSVARRWRISIKDGVEGGAQLADGILYFGAGDGQFYAVNPDNGLVLWTYPLKAEGIAEPLIQGETVYVLGGNNVLHVLNAKTGKLNWVYNRREASNISVRGGSRPALSGDLVLVGFSDGALVALNKGSGSMAWEANLNRNKRFRDVDATPVVDGDMIFASSYDGSLYALGLSDGKILWSVDEGGYSEVLVNGNAVYYSTTTGKTMALDRGTGKIIWSKDNPRGIATGPVLIKDVLVVGEMDGALRFLDSRTGDLVDEFSPGRGVTSKATVDAARGEVYFTSHDANLYALRVNWKRFGKDWPWE